MKYFCTNCGAEFLKWSGKCSSCGQWESLKEVELEDVVAGKDVLKSNVVSVSEFSGEERKERFSSGFEEFDRVLGGGVVAGSISLLAGEPGVGKSTLLSQVASFLSQSKKVLYISGEESPSQIFSRVNRLDGSKNLESKMLLSDQTNVEAIEKVIDDEEPFFVVVDSIQSLWSSSLRSFAGSLGQVRVCGAKLTRIAKSTGIPVFVIGQITKEGSVAGPKVLEHIVDTVLYVEGGEYNVFRILRSVKNRFGATNEIGVFEMTEKGMTEVKNPSKAFLEGGSWGPGSAIGGISKGSRVVFVEVQALAVDRGSEVGPLRRVANGIKKPRLDMLCAVLSRRGGVYLGDKDVFVNVIGGLAVDDPALDLAVCAAIKAAVKDIVLNKKDIYHGEVGLTGDIREGISSKSVMKEAKRLGYSNALASIKIKNIKNI